MSYAEVAVNSPVHHTFSYAIPTNTEVKVGQGVWVPFGSKVLQGILFQLTDYPAVEETREIIGLIDPCPLLLPHQLKLARWISEHYLAPLFASAALMLPPGFERKLITLLKLNPVPDFILSSLAREQRQVVALLQRKGEVVQREIERALGKKRAKQVVDQLLRKQVLTKRQELERVRVKPKVIPYLYLSVGAETAKQKAQCLVRMKRAPKQASLLEFLMAKCRPVPFSEARRRVGCSPQTVQVLRREGVVRFIKGSRRLTLSSKLGNFDKAVASLKKAPTQRAILELLHREGKPADIGEIKQSTGCSTVPIKALIAKDLVQMIKVDATIALAVDSQRAAEIIATLKAKGGERRQGKVLNLLAETSQPLRLSEVYSGTGVSLPLIKDLEEKGLVSVEQVQVVRDPLLGRLFPPSPPPTLTPAQEEVLSRIRVGACRDTPLP